MSRNEIHGSQIACDQKPLKLSPTSSTLAAEHCLRNLSFALGTIEIQQSVEVVAPARSVGIKRIFFDVYLLENGTLSEFPVPFVSPGVLA